MRSLGQSFVAVLYFQAIYSAEEEHSALGEQCSAQLDLSAEYDPLKLPNNFGKGPLDIKVGFDIRQVREVDESKKSYTIDLHIYMNWTDERLIGQTEKAKCNPVLPATATFWIPGDISLWLGTITQIKCSICFRSYFRIISKQE